MAHGRTKADGKETPVEATAERASVTAGRHDDGCQRR